MSWNFSHNLQHCLPIDLDTFGFVQREKKGGKLAAYRCGRDFLYYTLHYYRPEKYNPGNLSPQKIEDQSIFGYKLPWWLMWTGLQFKRLPLLLAQERLGLAINGVTIKNHTDLLLSLMMPRCIRADEAIRMIERSIDRGKVSGVDISLGLFGLVDHVMFAYAYDDSNFYIFDTQRVEKLEYEKVTPVHDPRFIMKLPKAIVRDRWSRWGRIWVITTLKP